MKINEEKYRIVEIDKKDIEKAKEMAKPKKNLIEAKQEYGDALGILGENIWFFWRERMERKVIFKKDVKDGKISHLKALAKEDDYEDQRKGVYNGKPDSKYSNKEIPIQKVQEGINTLQIEVKTKSCKVTSYGDYFKLFVDSPDMLFSIKPDDLRQLEGKPEGFTIIWGVEFEGTESIDNAKRAYCYLFSNKEILGMLRPQKVTKTKLSDAGRELHKEFGVKDWEKYPHHEPDMEQIRRNVEECNKYENDKGQMYRDWETDRKSVV